MTRSRSLPILCIAVISAACSVRPRVSDTGYTGTWSRGNDRNVSVVAIARTGDRYLFRWFKHSFDQRLDVSCGWDGRCEEKYDGKHMATYEFDTRVDPVTHRLMVECDERRLLPEKPNIHYIDELVVEPGGKVLWSYTVERDGKRYEGANRSMRSFEKVADAVAGVPRFHFR
jgi:hypothetical protein